MVSQPYLAQPQWPDSHPPDLCFYRSWEPHPLNLIVLFLSSDLLPCSWGLSCFSFCSPDPEQVSFLEWPFHGRTVRPSLTPLRTQAQAPSSISPPFPRPWTTSSLVPFYPCQTPSPGLTPALAEQKAASHCCYVITSIRPRDSRRECWERSDSCVDAPWRNSCPDLWLIISALAFAPTPPSAAHHPTTHLGLIRV